MINLMPLNIITSQPDPSKLPANYAISLDDFNAISLSGEDQTKYLQGQVTCDVNSLSDDSLTHGAHCDAKGKVLSVFRLINRAGKHLLLQSKASIPLSLAALKKFGAFAKVTISATTQLNFVALIGDNASTLLQQTFSKVPDISHPVIQADTTTLVYIAGKQARYLVIDESEVITQLLKKFNLPIYNQLVWQLTEIQEGFPVLTLGSLEQYVPQMLNLHAINGISFTKGCYLGQETVARMQYLGKNKRALFALSSDNAIELNIEIAAGDIIEKQLGENWRKAGDVLASYKADNQISLQAVLANDVDKNTVFRLKAQPEVIFAITQLPYSLNQED
jgi:folate-binding protein YgfZ